MFIYFSLLLLFVFLTQGFKFDAKPALARACVPVGLVKKINRIIRINLADVMNVSDYSTKPLNKHHAPSVSVSPAACKREKK